MKLKGVWGASLVMASILAIACGQEETAPLPEPTPAKLGTTRQRVSSSEKVLILGSSVNGGLSSVEAQAVAAFKPGWPIDVVTDEQWRAMTPAQFMEYQAIIIGDAACTSGTAAFQAAIDTRAFWAPVVDSNIVIVGTNSSSGSKPQITENGIEQVLMNGEQYRTSLYVSLGCAYQNAPAGTLVELLDHFGEFRVEGSASGCAATQGHKFEMSPNYLSHFLNDPYLGLGGCAARSVFTTYPDKNFAVAAIGLNAPGTQEYIDYIIDEPFPVSYFGTPYILVIGAMSVGSGCGGNSDNVPSGEQCDFGDMGNGVPASEGIPPFETCSFSCRQNWCGDGAVDTEYGEQCDNGFNNGRTRDGSGDLPNGSCSASCKIVNFPSTSHPPTAVCRDVTVPAPANACGAPADINNGSSDEDGDLVECTQSPAGPYNVGTTTVTLTCRDEAENTAQCQGTVTVTDVTGPVVTIGTPNRSMECNRNTGYLDLSDVSATDLCSNPLTALPATGTVLMGTPGTYTRTYPYRDAVGNTGTGTRTVVVSDTLPPTLNVSSPVTVECGGTYTDSGVSATDQCAGNLTGAIVRTGTVDTAVVGTYPLLYNVSDPTGHAAPQKTRNVNVVDRQRPTVTILGELSQTVECNDPTYVDPGATATDQCAGALPATANPPIPVGSPGGPYTIRYQATDPSGNVGTSSNSRSVTVQDTLPPTVALNGDAAMPLECATPWNDPGATASDQCAGTWNVPPSNAVNNRQLGAQTITYTATDPQGLSDSEIRTVTVSDTQAPVVTPNGPMSVAVECNDPTYADLGATVAEACDLTPPPAVIVNPPPVGTPGTYTVNYQATDSAGNVGTSATGRTVTVSDTLNPTVTLNGSAAMNLECADPWNDPGATASDQCSGSLPVTTTGTVDNRQLGAQTLTYTATDGSGHSDSEARTVTVLDTQAPTVTLNGPPSQVVECNDPTYQDPGATASDACDVPPPAAVAVNPPPVGTPGSYTVNYQATDRSGNVGTSATGRSVTVQDTLPPTLALNDPNPQPLECGTPWTDPGATASDQCAGVLNGAIVVSGGVNSGVPADYTVTYTVSDGQGHTLSQDRVVNVRDTLPPEIVVNGPVDEQFECGDTYVDPGATATDVCVGGAVPVTATRTGSSTTPGQFTITYSATDPSGNSITSPVVRTVHVNDNAAPTLALVGDPAPVVECATSWTDPGATANDACFGDISASIVRTGNADTGAPGTYPLTYNVTDPAGLSAPPVQRNVTVQDTQRPVVTVTGPLDIAVECGDGTYQDPGATAADSCAGTLPAVPTTVADPDAPGTYVIGYQATDPSGNVGTSATSRTVTVSDTLPPVLTLNPAPPTLECATPWNDPGATANDQCAGNITGLITRTGTVNNMQPGPYSVRYSVTDPSGRSDSEDRAVTVVDTQDPNITVLGPLEDSFECGDTYVDPGATANDACAGAVPVTSVRTGNPGQPGTFTISYSAEDPSGNSVTSSTVRTVTVNDDTPPTLVLLGPATETVECATSWTDQGATANDACFGDLTAAITRTGAVSIGVPGSYPLTYNVTDGAGLSAPPVTRTVNVNDSLAPSITVLGPLSQTVQCDHNPYPDPGATATDSCAGDLTGAIVRTGSVNTGAAGNYTLSYRVADPSGNQTTAAEVRTVTVVDDQPPAISLTGPADGTHECGSPYNDPGATANDACAGDLTANIVRTGSVDGSVLGAYTLNYTVTDPSNLTASTQRQVTVNDTLAPELALIGPATQSVECGPGYQDLGATATDACAGNMDSRIVVTGAADSTVVGNYTVTYNVSDDAGNAASPLTRQVQVSDTVAPTITVNGPLDQQFECGDTYVDPGATATDVCAGPVTVTSTRNGSSTTPGQFTITYSATDPSGNSVTSPVVRTVHVNDNAAPTLVLVGEASQTLECGTPWTDPGATANDACFGDISASIVRSGNVNSAAPGSYPIVYNVTDGAGNSAPSVNRTVQVQDTVLPVITVLGPTTDTYECGTTYTDPGATAADSCAGDLTSAIVATQTPDPGAPANFTITYTVSDPSGNTAVAAAGRTVTMNDNAPPTITLNGPASQVLECSRGTYDDPGAAANDLCVGPVPVTVVGSVNMGMAGTYQLRYSAQDTAGNTSATLTRDVTITDTTPPAITLNGPNAIHLECKVDEYTDLGATAEDICSGPADVTVDMSAVNTDVVGPYLVRYRAMDASGNVNETVRNVLVEDNLPPTLALNGASQVLLECATPFMDEGATASDICQGDVSSSVVVEFNGVDNMTETGTNPDGSPVYSYEVRYKAIDNFGHEAFLSRWVAVDDSIGPVLTVTGVDNEEVECGSQPDLGVQANDACYGILPPSSITASPAQLPSEPGEYTVTYSATDPAGNTTVGGATRTFTVVDTGLPEIVVNGPTELYYECTGHAIGNVWNNPGATATDTCEGELIVHQYNTGDDDGDGIPGDQDPDDFGPGPTTEVEGLYYVQYLAWDESFNIQGAILSVYVQDTLPPMLFLNGEETVQTQCFLPTDDPRDADEEVEVDPDPYLDAGAIGDDQCYGDVTPSVMTFGEVNKQSPGVYTLEYQVRDGAFNWAEPITRTVQVIDNIAPILVERDPLTLAPADNTMRTVELTECVLHAWDICEGYLNIGLRADSLTVTSNDPNMDPNDIVMIDNESFEVRVRNNVDGSSRVYTATFNISDTSGNVAQGECTMNVAAGFQASR